MVINFRIYRLIQSILCIFVSVNNRSIIIALHNKKIK